MECFLNVHHLLSTITIIILTIIVIIMVTNIMVAPGDELPRELGANSTACLRIVHQCHSVCGKLDNYLG